jgi:pimeloyl-ACP methyl ester carboxylesterase
MSAAQALAAVARPAIAAHRRVCHGFITAGDGVRLDYTDYGDPTARSTVVFLHGLCLSRASWIRQISYLAHRYSGAVRVVSYDHRGHGQSQSAPVSTYRPEQLADDLAHVITQLEITGSVILVGHSLGAMVALSYLARQSHDRPVDPEGLVLVATAAGRLAERGLGRLLAIPGIDGLSRLLEHAPQQALRTLSGPACTTLGRCWGYSSAQRAALAAVASAALMTTPTATVIGFLPALRDFNTHLSLQAIRARTVVISGSADPITPPVHSRELAAQIPDAVHVCVPGAGHMLAQQAPHVVASAIDHVIAPRSAHTGRRGCQFPLSRAVLREQGGLQ